MIIEYLRDPSGEWEELLVDGKQRYSGHQVPRYVFVDLLRELDVTVTEPAGHFCDCTSWVPRGKQCAICDFEEAQSK